MEVIHEVFGVNFVYDSALDLNIPYRGQSLPCHSLEASLDALFKGTGIDYEIMKKYIVLTKAGSKKKPKDYTIFIEEQHDTLNESRITAIVDRRRNAAQTGLEHVDASVFKRGFAALSAPDVIKTLQTVTGVSGGTELMNGLYVHGGTGNDNLYLYDGVPVYSVSHLAGLYSAFNTDVVDNVNFFKSGFPASYGGRLSSVVEVNTRDGSMTDYKGSFTVGLINGSIQYEGPIVKDRTSFNVAMRRSWLDVISVPGFAIFRAIVKNASDPYYEPMDARYAMTDFNAKVTHKIAEENVLRFGVIAGRDVLKYEYRDILSNVGEDYKFRWGNVVGYADWQNIIADDVHYDLKVYYTQHRSRMNWDKIKEMASSQRYDVRESWLTGIYDIGMKLDFDQQLDDVHRLRYGADQIFHVYRPEQSWSTADLSSGLMSASYFGTETAFYAEDEMTLGEKVTASVGLRNVLFCVKGKAYNRLEPRAALSYRPSELAALKVSYTEMNQFSHRLVTTYLDLPSSVWLPSTAEIAPMCSRQVAAGVYMTFPFNLQVDLEGFYKTMDHIREYKGYRLFPPIENWENAFVEGKGRAYGMETSVVYN
ncbi:MAG: TonB-dependent receptor, partial [Bacteroidales bacterium]|nr:TonB-dependent receptor [Bacteroidales bacterium]